MSTPTSQCPPTQPDQEGVDSPIGDLTKAFEFAMHQREFEISQLTQRNNFFMIFQGVLIAGIIQSQGTAAPVITFMVCLIGFATSLLQIGMAAGSKFWQIRWERAAKTTEIWLLEELKRHRRVSNFLTADGHFLVPDEKTRLLRINLSPERAADPITFDDGAISDANRKEISQGNPRLLRKFENWLILQKFSVSRIPIWAAIALTIFWMILFFCTVSLNGKAISAILDIVEVKIVPLKGDSTVVERSQPSRYPRHSNTTIKLPKSSPET